LKTIPILASALLEMKKASLGLLVLGIVLFILLIQRRREPFGMSPGTLDQLKSTHVTTAADIEFYNYTYPKIVRRDIADMTEEDPGDLRPWTFPQYTPNMTFFNRAG
jgi:hypothetical protein